MRSTAPGNGITPCGNGNDYCCYGLGGCSCSNSTLVFSLPGGTVVTTLPLTPSASTSAPTNTATSGGSGSTSPSNSSTLSSSATVGIGVGVGIGAFVILAAAVGVWWCLRQRQKNKEWHQPSVQEPLAAEGHPTHWYQMDAKPFSHHTPYQDHPRPKYGGRLDSQELDSHNISELPSSQPREY